MLSKYCWWITIINVIYSLYFLLITWIAVCCIFLITTYYVYVFDFFWISTCFSLTCTCLNARVLLLLLSSTFPTYYIRMTSDCHITIMYKNCSACVLPRNRDTNASFRWAFMEMFLSSSVHKRLQILASKGGWLSVTRFSFLPLNPCKQGRVTVCDEILIPCIHGGWLSVTRFSFLPSINRTHSCGFKILPILGYWFITVAIFFKDLSKISFL